VVVVVVVVVVVAPVQDVPQQPYGSISMAAMMTSTKTGTSPR
jgi:hypothetical protein